MKMEFQKDVQITNRQGKENRDEKQREKTKIKWQT